MRAVLRMRLIRTVCVDECFSVPDTGLRPYHGMPGSHRVEGSFGLRGLRDFRVTGMTELAPRPFLASALDRNSPGPPLAIGVICFPPLLSPLDPRHLQKCTPMESESRLSSGTFRSLASALGNEISRDDHQGYLNKPPNWYGGSLPIRKVETQMGTAPWSIILICTHIYLTPRFPKYWSLIRA